jgi:hypothetical protein
MGFLVTGIISGLSDRSHSNTRLRREKPSPATELTPEQNNYSYTQRGRDLNELMNTHDLTLSTNREHHMEFPIQFWHPSDEQALLIMGEYNLWLVLLSILVVIFAAFMAFFIAGQAQRAHQNITQRAMLLAGGFGLGGGIWAMHFIGMLACPLHTYVSYDLTLTLISLTPSIAASWLALSLLINHPNSYFRLFESGLILGKVRISGEILLG